MDADAPAHAVTHDGAAFGVHLRPRRQIAPCAGENFGKLTVGGFLLRFVHAVGFAEHFVEVGNYGRVAELGEVTNIDLHISGDAIMMMDDHDAGADRKSTRLNSSHLVISYAVF